MRLEARVEDGRIRKKVTEDRKSPCQRQTGVGFLENALYLRRESSAWWMFRDKYQPWQMCGFRIDGYLLIKHVSGYFLTVLLVDMSRIV